MSARRRNRDDVGMNLFPFMAVLICTMGSLIMLLVVMVQQARVRARETSTVDVSSVQAAKLATDKALAKQEQRRQEIQAAIDKQEIARKKHQTQVAKAKAAQQKLDEILWQIDEYRPSYDAVLKDLVDQRLALSHIEQHTRELSKQASKMQAEADLIAKNAEQGGSDVAAGRAELARLTTELAAARDQLDAEREKLKSQSTKHSLIAYDGPSGTQRPPIYIECLPDRVILQPENVTLIGEDFRTPLSNQNPLATALRAKREFMLKNGMLPNEMEPYPLLIVRPGGATSHAAARSAMKAWESEFGYELVESDIELDYQAADPRLAMLLDDVVIEARGRRKMMFAMMNRQRGRQREVLRPSRTGGFETVSNGSSSIVSGSNAAGNRSRSGGGNSNAPGPNPFETPPLGGTSSDAEQAGNQLAENRFTSPGRGSDASDTNLGGNADFGSDAGANGFDSNLAAQSPADSNTQSVLGFRDSGSQRGEQTSRFEGPIASQRPDGFTLNGSQNGFGSAGGPNSRGPGGLAANSAGSEAQGNSGQGASGTGGPSMQSGSAQAGSATGSGFAEYQSLAHSRGSGWAMRHTGDDVIGVKRPIQIVCEPSRLVVVPEKDTRTELQIFTHNGSLPAVIDPFVDAVQNRISSWGFAGEGIFWRPVLNVQVRSDAEGRYRQLLQLLDQSGIEVTREP